MRNRISLTIIVLFAGVSWMSAQDTKSEKPFGRVGLSYSSFGDNDVFVADELEGAGSYDSDYFFTIGVNYSYDLTKWLETEMGIEYSRQSVIVNPSDDPEFEGISTKESFSLINIPVTLKAKFLRFFFVNGGLFLDIDASADSPIDKQNGIGFLVGAGVKYDFKNNFSVFVNPYTKVHSVLSFGSYDHHEKIWENGWRMGVSFSLEMFKK